MKNVLALFDGMSAGQVALRRAGIPYEKYFASEIDKYAIAVAQHNFPDTIQLGDVKNIKGEDLPKLDLLMGGSPCQGFSFAGKQLAFDDPRSALFFEFVRLLEECKPKYFLLENVSMKKEFRDVISDFLGVEPICINSSLLSAQNRKRYYWTNIPNVCQPEDRGIILKDILQTDIPGNIEQTNRYIPKGSTADYIDPYNRREIKGNKSTTLRTNHANGNMWVKGCKEMGMAENIRGLDVVRRVYSPEGKSPALTAMTGGHRQPKVTLEDHLWRKLTPLECERLQTLPDNYTNAPLPAKKPKRVSKSQRYKMLGNGWTVDVIAHILENAKSLNTRTNQLYNKWLAYVGTNNVVVVDLFCGGGGFTQGAVEAGAVVALSVDNWAPAGDVHHANHPHIPFLQIDLGNLECDKATIEAYIRPYLARGYHFHLHGSPPCQALSNASRRDASEGMPMVMHFLALVEALNPDSWSMENVVPMRKRLPEDIPSRVLNAADYGVPQTRRRCIAGEGWDTKITHTKEHENGFKKWVSVLDALPHLNETYAIAPTSPRNAHKKNPDGSYELKGPSHYRSVTEPSTTIVASKRSEFAQITHLRGYSRTRPVMEKGEYVGMRPAIPPDGCRTLDEPSFAVCTNTMEMWGEEILAMDSGRGSSSTTGINPATGKRTGGFGPLYRPLDEPSYTVTSTPKSVVMINMEGAGPSVSKRARSSDADIEGPSKTVKHQAPGLRIVTKKDTMLNTIGGGPSQSDRIVGSDRVITEPSKTIMTQAPSLRDRITINDEVEIKKIRSLTIKEMAILQGFPTDYIFDSTKSKGDQRTIIGNAVAPPVAKAIIQGVQMDKSKYRR